MSILRHSATDWSFLGNSDPAEYYAALKRIGYSAVEMVKPANWPIAREAGLDIINMTAPGMKVGLNKLENHGELIPQIQNTITTAGANDIPYVIVFSGNREAGLTDAEGLANCIDGIRQLAPFAEQHGVVLLFEMLCAQNHKGYMADTAQFGFDVARAVDSPNVRLVYDIFHMAMMGEDVIGDVTGNLDIIHHLHVSGAPGRDFPGPDQEIDYATVVPAIYKAGYDKYWGQEYRVEGDSAKALAKAFELFEGYTTL